MSLEKERAKLVTMVKYYPGSCVKGETFKECSGCIVFRSELMWYGASEEADASICEPAWVYLDLEAFIQQGT